MTRIPYSYRPVPLTLAATVALLVTLAVPTLLGAQPTQSSTADTTISSEIPSPDTEPQRAQPAPAPDKSAPDVEIQPAPAPDKSGIDTATDVEIQRRFNELRRELLDHRLKLVDWWLAATALFLTLLGVVVVIAGYFSFQTFREIKTEARQNVATAKKHAEEAESLVEQIKSTREEAQSLLKDINAETAHNDPDKASEVVETVQQSPAASPTDRAVAYAISLQQQGKAEEAIEKWRSIANVAEGVDSQLQARAWFSVGYLYSEEDNWKAVIDANTRAIRLKPDNAYAYNNRGNAKNYLGQYQAALVDLDEAIRLKPDNAYAYNNRGITKKGLDQHEEALVDLDEAIRLKPDMASAYYNRGITKEDLGQPEAALTDYDKALELEPNDAGVYNNRGITKRNLGRLNEAREDYQKALALAQESGNDALIAKVQRNLSRLDNDQAP